MDLENAKRIGSFAGTVTAKNTDGSGSIQISETYGDAATFIQAGDELSIPAGGFSAQMPTARAGGYAEGSVATLGNDLVALDVTNPA